MPPPVFAACTTAGNLTTCSVTTNLGTAPIGNGSAGPDNRTVTVTANGSLIAGDASAVSLRDGAIVTLEDNALITSAGRTGTGLWGAGKNTIEFRSNGVLTVGNGASVTATGTSTNAEAVNLIGSGNTVINHGTISAINSAAIWFEDTVIGAANTIDNYGIVRTGNGSDQSIISNVIGSQRNGDVHFTNRTGAVVYGGLSFANGNDVLTLFPSSVVTGGFNGGGGTNTLTLTGEAGSSDTLSGNISNFQTLTKTGLGTWTLQGSVGSNSGNTALSVLVQQGTLALSGDNTNFNGSVLVDAAGILEARAQSLPPSVTDNGLVRFVQPDNGTYAGVIGGSGSVAKTGAGVLTLSGANSYQAGTLIQGGTVAIGADNRLGAAAGAVTLDGGALELTSSFDLSASRAITVTANNGTIQADAGVSSTVSQAITGAGALTKAGAGLLVLANDNSYAGGTTIGGGTLQLGNGGTTGSIVGNVANDGTLVFNRSGPITFDGTISGTGSVAQAGAGVTTLTGNNTYTGTTTVSSGWLYVDGNQSAATGATTVASGTRLAGNGIVGGSVTIADGATLAPGAVPQTPGTLTINGNLSLNPTSNLFYNMVQANVAGGQRNDLTVVGGNLVLDGVINVVDQGQTLGPGVYRIIDYSGTLTNNGLTIGSYMTAPATPQDTPTVVAPLTNFSVQTSIAGQVNLINTSGLTLNYWDGDLGPKNNGVINGGSGTWRVAGPASTFNWTNPDGTINAPWANGEFAIFMATPGTVTVNSDQGAVVSRGMQFASDGYTVNGDPITLQNPAEGNITYIRVGDGTSASASMTATIDANLTGTAALIKEDLGTLVLNGTNSYTSGTGVFGGTLQISRDENLGQATGAVAIVNGSTLRTTGTFATNRLVILGSSGNGPSSGTIETAAGTTLTLNGAIQEDPSIPAALQKAGAGTLVLTSNSNNYSAGTTIAAGTLQLGNGGTTGSIVGNVTDNGTLAFNRSDTVTFGGIVSGSGTLSQIGAGTTVLTSDNTYAGGTTITAGTLQLGNGGTTGSIVGNVANDGALVFNRSGPITFDGTISGTGSVAQASTGVTTLTGNNTYTGTTTVSSGWLYVDGNQSAATGTTTVASGARLAGNGIVGGSVTIADGATLAPGAVPQTPGTLTINGNLNLNPTSNLFYNMVQANVAGGQRNDLTVVGGNLVLDGVINVVDQGQTLGPGVYRIIDYSGTLTNNGLTIGSYMTAPATPQDTPTVVAPLTNFSVQTSIAGQVNLINTSGLTLNYWDGDLGPKNNGVINGGSGTWRVAGPASTFNWTNPDGTINAPWANGEFAIFMATPGTVTVNSDQGAVVSRGMQFASDGYTVNGDPITLQNPAEGNITYIRVGDGTSASTSMTATIDANLTGTAALIKEDLGTLVLNGTNSYTSGTGVFGGALQISRDENLGQATGAVAIVNGSTLRTTGTFATNRLVILGSSGNGPSSGTIETAAGTTLTLNGAIQEDPSIPAALQKAGAGTLVLTSNSNNYSAGTTIAAGTLQLGNGGTTGSILGNVTNNGTLAFNRSDTVTFGGIVSGSGALSQIGAGTTVLTSDNTYAGGTTITAGTLQLGNGGTTGSIVGNVANDGALAFNRSDTMTFDGIVSGGGVVNQIGAGTTVLTNTNIYTGGTTISAGTLQLGNGGTTGSIIGNVANDGALAFNRSDTMTFDGIVSGGGVVNQIGAGTTVLTNTNIYTGGTTISAGALQLGAGAGAGGATGSIVGDVNNNGVLIFNRSNDLTFGGRILGSGSVVQQGAGTTVLTGGSTYSGGTTISAGTLQLGNGGNAGSIVGNIVNNATLAVEHSDVLPIVGDISGTGNIIQRGTGATVLLGTNSYSGPTNVLSGGLYVDGNQAAATGLTTAAAGSTLGGSGIIGGNVDIASGGALAPGQVGIAPGTLTINGNLNLNGGSALTYGFGQANVIGGPLNDLTVVQGNLTLAGTLNVETTEGGSFDPGIYRVISYAGTLANNGLAIGTIPSPDFFVQTTVNHQVNLVNTAGMLFNYWDGTAGPKDNSLIDGGDGIWQNATGNNNWTNELAVPNAAFADRAFAIFMAAPGTVTVDGSLGPVTASGMQFASNGYVVRGAPITLVDSAATPGESIIRVGDGSGPSAGFVATIDSVLTGTTTLVKSDIGTLVLNGANTYTGGTAIRGGVLQVAADNNLGAASTPLSLDGGTLRTTATFTSARAATLGEQGGTFESLAGTTLTLASAASGAGTLTKTGAGTLVLTADNTYTGNTIVSAGTLQVGNGGTTGNLAGNVINDSVLAFNRSDIATIRGNIWGSGAVNQIGSGVTVLSGDNTYTGDTTVASGTLRAGATGSFSAGSRFDVAAGTTLDLNGFSQTIAGLTNGGMVRLGGAPGTTLRVVGNYVGNGGLLALNTYLGTDNSPSDRLVIDGGTATAATPASVGANAAVRVPAAVAGGSTAMVVSNVGGPGARTTGDGILLVDAINGATTAPAAFVMGGRLLAGPYEYSLFRGGASGASPDSWFLRSTLDCAAAPGSPECQSTGGPPPAPPNYRSETSLYTAIPSLALTYGNALLDTLHERMGGQVAPQPDDPRNLRRAPVPLGWGRFIGLGGSKDGGRLGIYGGNGPDYDYRMFAVQAGMDVYRKRRPDNSADNAGLYFATGQVNSDVMHFDGSRAGSDRIDGVTLGGYWTHFGPGGWYVDGVLQGTRYDTTASGRLPATTRARGNGVAASLEGGYPVPLANGLVVEPQAQLTYQAVFLGDTRDQAASIRFNNERSMVGRLGVRVSRTWDMDQSATRETPPRRTMAWARVSVVNEFLGRPETQFSSADGYVAFRSDTRGAGAKLDLGVDAQITRDTSFYGSVQGVVSGDGHAVGGQIGVKVKF
ncbi:MULTISPECIES: autotransporter-associated beta strand repeat-containing protein [Cupriavidus]